jgi:para-nitrobenzyl esterase
MMQYVDLKTSFAKALLSILALCSLISCNSGGGTPPPQVSTSLGLIQGVQRYNAVNEYRGIPYAKPLTAQDRWTLAQAALPWEGTLNASQFGAAYSRAPF